ncbi:MAG: DUF481 domain-containing protein [Chlorobi bacterium]|nr:DUF481 domain-containing protein [Chlorobiota bacterium]
MWEASMTIRKFIHSLLPLSLITLSGIFTDSNAQILNAEALRLKQTEGWAGRLKLSLNLHKSTYDIQKYGLDLHTQYRTGNHMFLFMNSFMLQLVDGDKIRDKLVVHLRYNLEKWLEKRVVSELFVQYQKNSVTGIKHRYTSGLGPRIVVIRQETWNLFLGPLIMYEYEEGVIRDTATAVIQTIRNSTYLSFSLKSESSIVITSVLYFQPSLVSISDWRLYWDFGLEFPLYKKVKFVNGFYVLYDTEPVPTYPQLQYSLNASLIVDF